MSFEPEFQFGFVQPRQALRHFMPGHAAQDRVVGPAREGDDESLAAKTYLGLALDEEPIDLGGVTGFKSP